MKGIVALFLPGLHTTGKHDYAQYLRDQLLDNDYKVVIFSSFSDLYSKESMIEGEKSIYKLYDKIDIFQRSLQQGKHDRRRKEHLQTL